MLEEYVIPFEINQSDRIGNFTFPQVITLGVGFFIVMMMAVFMPLTYAGVLSLPVVVITLFFMYKKINGIPIHEFLFVYATFYATPTILVFRSTNIRGGIDEDEVNFLEVVEEGK